MAKKTETLTIKVDADTKAADRKLSALDKDLDQLGGGSKKTIKVDADTKSADRAISDLLRDVDKLSSEDATIQLKLEEANLQAQLASIMADVEKLDASDPTIDIKMAQGDAIISNLDKVNTRLADLDQKNKNVHDSADQSRSVLANMVGNSVQDLGNLGGVAGSAGVLIGQLGEYAADGNIKLKSLAALAGPMAGLAVASLAVTKAVGAIKLKDAFDVSEVERFTDALREGESAALTLFDAVAETGKIDFTNWGILSASTDNLIPTLKELGISYGQVQQLVEQGPEALINYANSLNVLAQNAEKAGDMDLGDKYRDASNGLRQYAGNVQAANDAQAALNDWLELTPDLADELFQSLKQSEDPMSTMTDSWSTLMADMEDGSVDTQAAADAVLELSKALGESPADIEKMAWEELAEQWAEAAEAAQALAEATQQVNTADFRGGAISTVFDQLNELSRLDTSTQLTDIADAWTAIDDAARDFPDSIVGFDLIPDNWDEVQNMPDDLKGITAAIGGFRDATQTQLAEAFTFGGPEALRQAASDITTEFEGPFREMMARNGASVEETDAAWKQFLQDVGLAPENIEMTVTLAIDQQKLQVLQDIASGAGLTGETKLNFDIAIANQDPTTALAILNAQLAGVGKEVVITYNADTGQVETQLRDISDPDPVTVTTQADTSATDAVLGGYYVSGIFVPVATTPDETFTTTAQQIDEFGNPVNVTVFAPKSDSLGAMDKLIDHVARARKVDLNVKADNAGAIDRILDKIAEQRDAHFFAQADNVTPTDTTLDTLAMPTEDGRLAHIFAQPDNIGPADQALDGVAHDRNAHIHVKADDAGYVNQVLDQVARDRTADIFIVTHNSTAGGGGGGGGGGGNTVNGQAAPLSAEATSFGVDAFSVPIDEISVPSSTVASSTSFMVPVSQPSVTNNYLNVKVQAAVIGNRFEVQRAVSRAVRGDKRLERDPLMTMTMTMKGDGTGVPSILNLDGVRPFVELGVGSIYNDSGNGQWDIDRWDDPGATWAGDLPLWLDITCHVMDVASAAGRERVIDQWTVGTATFTCENRDGWADFPSSIDDLLAGDTLLTIRPGRSIRVGIWVYGQQPVILWAGYIDAANPSYEAGVGPVMTLECIDAKGDAGRADVPKLATAVGAGETVNNRIIRILDGASWPSYRRDIDTSGVALVATTLGGTAVDLLNRAADSAGGQVFGDLGENDSDPRLAYRSRDWPNYDHDDPIMGTIGNFGYEGEPGHFGEVVLPEDPPGSDLFDFSPLITDEDPDGSDLYRVLDPSVSAIEDPPGSGLLMIVSPPYVPAIPPDTCPSMWELSFARSDISTRVLLGRQGEPEHVYDDTHQGLGMFGTETYKRNDLETSSNVDLDWLGNRIRTNRNWTYMPRVVAVTVHAKRDHPETIDTLLKASPYAAARFRCQHRDSSRPPGDQVVFDRVMMVTGVEHTITPTEWSARISLDDAAPYLVSGVQPAHWDEADIALWDVATWANPT